MNRQPLLPSPVEARRLADLVADALAIPSAAFASCPRGAVATEPSGTAAPDTPAQPFGIRIPRQTVSLVEAADHHWAGFSH